MLNLDEKPENPIRLTLSYQIQRCGLQHLIRPDQPDYTPLTENLLCPRNHCGDLWPRAFEGPELLNLSFKISDRLVQQGVNIHCGVILVDTVGFVWSLALTLRNHPPFQGKVLDTTIVFVNKPDVGMCIRLKIPINLVGRHIDSLRCSAKESQEFELSATA
jgi:hypothetical protein